MNVRGFMGVGLGLRRPHIREATERIDHPVPFWEIAPENVLGEGGSLHRVALEVLRRDPVLTHGLSLSVGGFDPWDEDYLRELAAFIEFTGTPWHSEHLCFTSVDGTNTHELLPLPFTREAVRHVVGRVKALQARLPVPLLVENITYYAELGAAEMDEADFVTEVLEGADCGWLLDISNVYVNSQNYGFDPHRWLERAPLHRVRQMHIAGCTRSGEVLLDTHGEPVADPAIELMRWALSKIGRPVPVLLERDHNLPEFDALLMEREKVQEAFDEALAPLRTEVTHA